MIGGYLFRDEEENVNYKLMNALPKSFNKKSLGDYGLLFYDNPYSDFKTGLYSSDTLTILSQDLLVTSNSNGEYTSLDTSKNLADLFLQKKTELFKDIVSDYRLVVIEHNKTDTNLYLVSHRAGNGRMYYITLENGILFSSDIRFLLKIVPFSVNDLGVYSMLKFGAIPEPMTISQNINAVPAAHYLNYNLNRNSSQSKVYFQFDFPNDNISDTHYDLNASLLPAKQKLVNSARFLRQYDPSILISGGIDSSLYASYLNEAGENRLQGIHCTFGDDDPELAYAVMLAKKINAHFHIGHMEQDNALEILHDAIDLTSHPFSDFSSLPIVFILKFLKEQVKNAHMLIEGNGGDDCFGFADLTSQSKMLMKSWFPRLGKNIISSIGENSKSWKWESSTSIFSRLLALSDVHEVNPINYFMVLTPVNFIGLKDYQHWDEKLSELMDTVFSSYSQDHNSLSYPAKVTIRQIMHVNSRRWAAKAFSVGENLGIRIIYPFIWRDILMEQGKIPWQAKINNGVVKWPLKRLLEEYMPYDFIYRPKSGFVPPFVQWLTSKNFNNFARDILLSSEATMGSVVNRRIFEELLEDALNGKKLRHAVLNFLWGALFTELWIKKYNNVL